MGGGESILDTDGGQNHDRSALGEWIFDEDNDGDLETGADIETGVLLSRTAGSDDHGDGVPGTRDIESCLMREGVMPDFANALDEEEKTEEPHYESSEKMNDPHDDESSEKTTGDDAESKEANPHISKWGILAAGAFFLGQRVFRNNDDDMVDDVAGNFDGGGANGGGANGGGANGGGANGGGANGGGANEVSQAAQAHAPPPNQAQ
jgi:hypothetical protein